MRFIWIVPRFISLWCPRRLQLTVRCTMPSGSCWLTALACPEDRQWLIPRYAMPMWGDAEASVKRSVACPACQWPCEGLMGRRCLGVLWKSAPFIPRLLTKACLVNSVRATFLVSVTAEEVLQHRVCVCVHLVFLYSGSGLRDRRGRDFCVTPSTPGICLWARKDGICQTPGGKSAGADTSTSCLSLAIICVWTRTDRRPSTSAG